MTRPVLQKLIVAAAGGFAAAGLVLIGLLALDFVGSGRSTVLMGTGWMLPLLAGALTGVVAWMLVRGSAREGESCGWHHTGTTCPSCGGSVRADWRLCPHCGNRLTNG